MTLARSLKIDSVSRLMPTPPHRLSSGHTVADAVDLMHREQVGCLLVCDGERVVGIFTERDLLRRVLATRLPLSTPLQQCMTADPVVVGSKNSVGSALRRMQKGGYRHLPVLDETGQPVGILSVKRIVHYLVEHFPTTVYNLPPDPGAVPHSPEGA